MQGWAQTLAATDIGKSFHFWTPTYDTAWRTFPQSARLLKVLLEKTGFDFDQTLILGYSMGGLVARELARNGFPCQKVITLCTPHQGAAPWVPVMWRRTRSVGSNSRLIQELNSASGDVNQREKYHFWAVNYRDPYGVHQHDGIIELSSALGRCLDDENIHRHVYSTTMKKPVLGIGLAQPHVRALHPQQLPNAFHHAVELLSEIGT